MVTEAPTRRRPNAVVVPLLPPALAYAVLTIMAATVPSAIAGVAAWKSDANLLDFYQHHGDAAHAGAFFTLAAAVPFAVFTAVTTSRLRSLGLDVPGRMIALVGGTIAAALLALAGLTELALTRSHVSDSASVVRAFDGLLFACGGVGFVVFAGLLAAGVSITGLLGRVLPPWLAWLGIATAVVSELASLAAAFPALEFLLPVGRAGGLIWMVLVAVRLPRKR